ncbi:hypothetical protein GLYMA_20G024300v4 [Glycine max]|nr:hypothetical protein GLYMA_20G024300v4 [Glycine max]KAH1034214.1 hypothetical protein GYH30_054559 [Glycine max]
MPISPKFSFLLLTALHFTSLQFPKIPNSNGRSRIRSTAPQGHGGVQVQRLQQ